MTATTKGQRDELLRLAHKIIRPLSVSRVDVDEFNRMCALIVPNLLSDSERLAAIEAVTGEEVGELIGGLPVEADTLEIIGHDGLAAMLRETASALLSLSAKVAEQAEEIERLKATLEETRHELDVFSDSNTEQTAILDRMANGIGLPQDEEFDLSHAGALLSERDILRRLLTETAVPALERIERRDFLMADLKAVTTPERVASSALSTIRAQMENSTETPHPARCSTCDDTRIIYGHGSFGTSCPACHDADAEDGLAMLGGDGRGLWHEVTMP